MRNNSDVVLVTGATGKQGGAVARELLAAGYHVQAMTRKPDGAPAKELAPIDLRSDIALSACTDPHATN